MGHSDDGLQWWPDSIASIMRRNGIQTRRDLAHLVEPLGISEATVYRLFTADWHGEATARMVAILARMFRVSVNQLVKEPFDAEESA